MRRLKIAAGSSHAAVVTPRHWRAVVAIATTAICRYPPQDRRAREETHMYRTDPKRLDPKARAIEAALRRIGEPITEAQARELASLEDCNCRDGMFALATTRRQLFAGSGLVAGVGMTASLPGRAHAKSPPLAVQYPWPPTSPEHPHLEMSVE